MTKGFVLLFIYILSIINSIFGFSVKEINGKVEETIAVEKMDSEDISVKEENEETETINETTSETVETVSETIDETTSETIVIETENKKDEEETRVDNETKDKLITCQPVYNPRIKITELSVDMRNVVNTILLKMKDGKSFMLDISLDTAEDAIKYLEEIYYPYTFGGTGLHAAYTNDGIFITFHSHAYSLYQKNEYIAKRIRDTSHMMFKKGMTERQAIKLINDWVINAVDYDKEKRDLYSLFYYHKGNCQSYSNVFEQFCDYIGIECKSIVGEVNGEGHEWNKVKMNDKWYYIDTTFNQGTDNKYYLSEELWNGYKISLEYKSTYPERANY